MVPPVGLFDMLGVVVMAGHYGLLCEELLLVLHVPYVASYLPAQPSPLSESIVEDTIPRTALIFALVKCRLSNLARNAFDEMLDPNLIFWATLIFAYAKASRYVDVLSTFLSMRATNVAPIFLCRAVVDHSLGKQLPSISVQSFESLPGRGILPTLTGIKELHR